MRFIRLTLWIIILLIGACAPKANIPSNTLILSLTSDPKTFNFMVAKETSSTAILSHLFDGLTQLNSITKEVKPALATHWTRSKDGRTWRFFLRKGVLWRDGKPFTADDVVFTFNDLIFNPKVSTSSRFTFTIDNKPLKVRKINAYEVEFILPKPFVPFLNSLGESILPKHILAPYVAKGVFNSTWGINTPPKEIIGTGAYYIDSYKQSDKIILKKNPSYWKKGSANQTLPLIETILYLIVKDANAARLLFKQGITDAYSMAPKDWGLLYRKQKKGNYSMLNLGADKGSSFLVFNLNPGKNNEGRPFVDPLRREVFENIYFRRAIAHAIDKQSIIENYYYNLAQDQFNGVWEESPFFNPHVRKYSFDLNRANELLDKAGLSKRDSEGYRLMSNGQRFYFSLLIRAESDTYQKISNQLVGDLKKAGIQVFLKPILFNTLVQKLTSTFDWEATFIGLTGGLEPHFGRNVWHSSGVLHMWHPMQKTPLRAWEKEIDHIFDTGMSELDPVRRKAVYARWQELVAENLPVIYTVKTPILYAVRNRFEGMKPNAYGGLFHNLEEIRIIDRPADR